MGLTPPRGEKRLVGIKRAFACLLALVPGAMAGSMGGPAPADTFRFVPGQGYLDLLLGSTPVYRHVTAFDPARIAETFKVYHHVYGFHGEGFITKGSEGTYPHQRGLSLAWLSATANGKTTDTWQGLGAEGWQKHGRYLPERDIATAGMARKASVTDWMDPSGAVVVHDTREVTARFSDTGRLVLDFSITIASAGGTVTLAGNAHHGGFQFRGVDNPVPMEFLLPADADSLEDDAFALDGSAAWALSRYSVKGHPYAVLLMDHSFNPRPVQLGKRAYGRFGFFFPARIPEDKPLMLNYRIVIMDRVKFPTLTREEIRIAYKDYSAGNPVALEAPRVGRPRGKMKSGIPPDFQITGRRLSPPALDKP